MPIETTDNFNLEDVLPEWARRLPTDVAVLPPPIPLNPPEEVDLSVRGAAALQRDLSTLRSRNQLLEARLKELTSPRSPSALPGPTWVENGVTYRGFNVVMHMTRINKDHTNAKGEVGVLTAIVPKPVSLPITLWLRESTPLASTTLRTFTTNLILPHIDASSACMGIADLPNSLTTRLDYNQVHQGITRGLNAIQIDSLYSDYRCWPRPLWMSIPGPIRRWIRSSTRRNWDAAKELFTFERTEGSTWRTATEG